MQDLTNICLQRLATAIEQIALARKQDDARPENNLSAATSGHHIADGLGKQKTESAPPHETAGL